VWSFNVSKIKLSASILLSPFLSLRFGSFRAILWSSKHDKLKRRGVFIVGGIAIGGINYYLIPVVS
jgi:hypothetical protein